MKNEQLIKRQGEQMHVISFKELMEQLTGRPFEEIFNDNLIEVDNDEKNNVERSS